MESLYKSWYGCGGGIRPCDGKKFYAFYNGKFYISTDGGLTFTDTKAPQLPKSVNKIKAVPGKEGHVWLAAREGGLWRSTDGGYTFEKLSNVDTAHVVGFGKAAPDRITWRFTLPVKLTMFRILPFR